MIFEDVHLIDPTSLEALGRSVDRLRTLGVLLIFKYLLEFEPPWIARHYVTAISLNRLGERENRLDDRQRHREQATIWKHQTGHHRSIGA
jgi:predicted ATPase